MSTKHTLSLDIPETATPHTLRIVDTSAYASALPIECLRLDITLPGFTQPTYIQDFTENFSMNLTGLDLGVQSGSGNPLVTLPDGIYTIKYSVAPTELVWVEYKHLRYTNTLNKYYRILCDLELQACEPTYEIKKQLNQLREIRSFIDAAKGMVELCGDIKKGIDVFIYAQKLLNKFNNQSCKNC